jgi:carbonic anhydrase
MRNIGGRVTDEVIRQIAILLALTVEFGGGTTLEVAIVHHTDCGTGRFTDPQVRQRLGQAAGTSDAVIERLAITDPQISVAEDLDRLRAAPTLPDELVVAGYVYDVTDGRLREISAPAPLRE